LSSIKADVADLKFFVCLVCRFRPTLVHILAVLWDL
jgi:hypothetical protein